MRGTSRVTVGVTTLPRTPQQVAELAVVAERAGLDAIGVADSSHLFGATYPAIQHALGATHRVAVGPFVTNPVTRHVSVHAADIAALAQLHPGRLRVAMGTGDSAVHSVGLRPGSPDDVVTALARVRELSGADVRLEMAVSGPRAAAAVPDWIDGVVLGGGMCLPWLQRLGEAAGVPVTLFLVGHLVPDEDEVPAAREAVRASVVAVARHALAGDLAARGVPAPLRSGVAELLGRYDFAAHARAGGPNDTLLDAYPQEASYLLDRFAAVGTPGDVAERLRPLVDAAGVTSVVLTSTVPDQIRHVRLAGDLAARLADPARTSTESTRVLRSRA